MLCNVILIFVLFSLNSLWARRFSCGPLKFLFWGPAWPLENLTKLHPCIFNVQTMTLCDEVQSSSEDMTPMVSGTTIKASRRKKSSKKRDLSDDKRKTDIQEEERALNVCEGDWSTEDVRESRVQTANTSDNETETVEIAEDRHTIDAKEVKKLREKKKREKEELRLEDIHGPKCLEIRKLLRSGDMAWQLGHAFVLTACRKLGKNMKILKGSENQLHIHLSTGM